MFFFKLVSKNCFRKHNEMSSTKQSLQINNIFNDLKIVFYFYFLILFDLFFFWKQFLKTK